MVSKFILTDANKDSQAQISPLALLRLARLQQPDMPLLPSLSDLVIVDADASIAHLELLLTPSLKSLKASCIPDTQQSGFFSFLNALEQEAPLLQTLIFGSGRFESSSLQIIYQFNNLRHLELKNDNSELPFAFFDNIGSLPKLETFILDARHVSSTTTTKQTIDIDVPIPPPFLKDPDSLPSDLPKSNLVDGKSDVEGASDALVSQTSCSPTSTTGTFNQLVKLHITGWLPMLEDLIPRITSTRLGDVSVTLIRLSYEELQVSLAKEKVEREKIAEERRRRREEEEAEPERVAAETAERERRKEEIREEIRRIEEELKNKKAEEKEAEDMFWGGVPWMDEAIKKPNMEAGEGWRWEMGKRDKKLPNDDLPPPFFPDDYNRCFPDGGKKKKKKGNDLERQLREEQENLRLAFDTHTASFTELLRTLYHRWTVSLKTVSVCQLGGSFQQLSKPATLPKVIFRELLLLPAIESLEVKGWMLDSVESDIQGVESIPNLKSLLLPVDETNSGISLPTLRHVAETCPRLEIFQTRIEPLSLVPEYSVPTTEALSHGLQVLSVGNSSPHPDSKKLYLIARHLYLLFPNLETINTFPEYNAEQWVDIDRWVKGFQTARIDDMNRPH